MAGRFEDFLEPRKVEIITAVLKLADEVGVTGITTKRIAREVGFVEAALYRHIKTKFDVFRMILDLSEKFLIQEFRDLAARKLSAGDALREWFKYAVSYLEEYPGMYRILFSDALYIKDKELYDRFKKITFELKDKLERIFRAGIKAELFRPDLKPESMAILYLGVIHTAFTLWTVFDDRARRFRDIAMPLFDDFMKAMLAGPKDNGRD
jgi:TetR/AcrR family transcriptional regulator